MFVRLEKIRGSENLLVIDEVGKYIGQIDSEELFFECTDENRDILEEDDYIFFFVSKECLNNKLKK